MKWFDRHINWIAGIFGHLLIFLLIMLYISPSCAYAHYFLNSLLMRITSFREPDFGFYNNIFMCSYFFLVLALYFGVNIWYLYRKCQSYKYLWFLLLPFIPIFAVYVTNENGVLPDIDLPHIPKLIIQWAMIAVTFILQPVWFGLIAFMLFRLKNNRIPIQEST
jgi:hypothetical protein